MKPFNLKEALAGNLVQLRNGEKALILKDFSDSEFVFNKKYPIYGLIIEEENKISFTRSWATTGRHYLDQESELDIIGMYETPTQTITLTLPCSAKKTEDKKFGVYLSDDLGRRLTKNVYFSKMEDVEKWVNALKNNHTAP